MNTITKIKVLRLCKALDLKYDSFVQKYNHLVYLGPIEVLPKHIEHLKTIGCDTSSLSYFKTINLQKICGGLTLRFLEELTSLDGCPRRIEKSFSVSNTSIKNLVGGPKTVLGHYWCNDNKLTSLLGSPRVVKFSFSCSGNNLTNLEHGPEILLGAYDCSYNKLTTLQTTIMCNLILKFQMNLSQYIHLRLNILQFIYLASYTWGLNVGI